MLKKQLEDTPSEQFAKRYDIYRSTLCFGKFLIRENCLSPLFAEQAALIKPKPHKTPQRLTVNTAQLEALQNACRTPLEHLIILLLSSTGLRASEFCALRVKDLHLDEGFLIVNRGKGGKRRRIGINLELNTLLQSHLHSHIAPKPDDYLFLNKRGEPLERDGLCSRIRRIGARVDVQVSPHALRRCFVILNANKGRSLVMLQMACGHADIKTTRSYCQTTEDEMIAEMRNWG